jgi:hypothetical protein
LVGFEVTLYGRFWVTPEARIEKASVGALAFKSRAKDEQMPLTAPATAIVSAPAPDVKRADPNSSTRQRCDYRRQVVFDTKLSASARLLYVALDDYAGSRAEAWPRQKVLAEQFGVHRSQIKRWLGELIAAGYVVSRRTGRNNRYLLFWGKGAKTRPMANRIGRENAPSDGAKMRPGISYEPDYEPEPEGAAPEWKCGYCRDRGVVSDHGERKPCGSCAKGRALNARMG